MNIHKRLKGRSTELVEGQKYGVRALPQIQVPLPRLLFRGGVAKPERIGKEKSWGIARKESRSKRLPSLSYFLLYWLVDFSLLMTLWTIHLGNLV